MFVTCIKSHLKGWNRILLVLLKVNCIVCKKIPSPPLANGGNLCPPLAETRGALAPPWLGEGGALAPPLDEKACSTLTGEDKVNNCKRPNTRDLDKLVSPTQGR